MSRRPRTPSRVRARWLADALICRRHRAHVRSDASLSSEESSSWRSASLLSCQTYGQPCHGVHRCPACCPCPSASRSSHREPFSRVWPTRSRSCRSSLACEEEQSRYRAVASGTRHTPRTTGGRAQRTLDGHADRWGPMSSRAFLGASRGRVRSRRPRDTPREGNQPDQPEALGPSCVADAVLHCIPVLTLIASRPKRCCSTHQCGRAHPGRIGYCGRSSSFPSVTAPSQSLPR
jgi:hypothetical protein